jgi:hypothetical protein
LSLTPHFCVAYLRDQGLSEEAHEFVSVCTEIAWRAPRQPEHAE